MELIITLCVTVLGVWVMYQTISRELPVAFKWLVSGFVVLTCLLTGYQQGEREDALYPFESGSDQISGHNPQKMLMHKEPVNNNAVHIIYVQAQANGDAFQFKSIPAATDVEVMPYPLAEPGEEAFLIR